MSSDIVMSDEHKKLLQSNLNNLQKNLNLQELLDYMISNFRFSQNDYEKIMAEKTNNDKIRKLVFTLHRLPDSAYFQFMSSLENTDQKHIIDLIDPSYQCPNRDFVDLITTIEQNDLSTIEIIKMTKAKKMSLFRNNDTYKIEEAECYGRALIINNEQFDYMSRRNGTEKDVNLLEKCFKELHYKTIILRNLTAHVMIDELRSEAENKEHESSPSFILCILSHGCNGRIYGTDGNNEMNSVGIDEVESVFDARNCKALSSKPKLFFIQACQIDIPMGITNLRKSVQVHDEDSSRHHLSDMFLFISTVAGEKSWRHPSKGTPFINSLVYALKLYAHEHDLNYICTKVIEMVSTRKITDNVFQLPEIHTRLIKKFYFMP